MLEGGRSKNDAASMLTVECTDDRGVLHEVDTVLGFMSSDPYAVSMTFATADGDVVWTFSRDLLIRGLHSPTGDGDVHVSPAVDDEGSLRVSIELSSSDGQLGLLAKTSDIIDFLARAAAIVPPGSESKYFDVDLLIRQVLASQL